MTRHRIDPLSFAFGLVFAVIAVAGLTGPWDLRATDLAWLGPALFLLVGLALLVSGLGRGRDDGGDRRDGGGLRDGGDASDGGDPRDGGGDASDGGAPYDGGGDLRAGGAADEP